MQAVNRIRTFLITYNISTETNISKYKQKKLVLKAIKKMEFTEGSSVHLGNNLHILYTEYGIKEVRDALYDIIEYDNFFLIIDITKSDACWHGTNDDEPLDDFLRYTIKHMIY
ncbi:MAG: hypothetical protein LBC08_01175 [Campylobacteraceae bacterium]|jgi:hypothetical protein|nr:hypothetical protein [Campylobacteraceae bacterium]